LYISAAKAGSGIAVAVVLVILAVIIIGVVLMYLWKRHKRTNGRYNVCYRPV